MFTYTETAIAGKLLEVEAVKLNVQEPFTWASGWKSPVYCDNRKLLSFPQVRDFIKSELCSVIFEKYPEAECLAAVATAGIAWGAMASDQLKLPFIYVRPTPKVHGMGNQVEGHIKPGNKVLVIEDLVSTGKSSLKVCEVLRDSGLEVLGMVSIFTYGFPVAAASFEQAGIQFHALTNYGALLNIALEKEYIDKSHLKTLLNWGNAPSEWNGIA